MGRLLDFVSDMMKGIDTKNTKVVIWVGCYIHSFLGEGDSRWHGRYTRPKLISDFLQFVRDKWHNVTTIWVGPSFVDLPIMRAHPGKQLRDKYEKFNIPEVAGPMSEWDEEFTRLAHIPFVNRYELEKAYRGLHCDGIHIFPHAETNAASWKCQGFPALDDLILQAGLHSACGAGAIRIC